MRQSFEPLKWLYLVSLMFVNKIFGLFYAEQIAGMPKKLFLQNCFTELVLVNAVYEVFSFDKV